MNKLFLILLLTIVGFQDQSTAPGKANSSQQLEGISPQVVTINRVILFYTNPKKLVQLLSKPDRIVSRDVGCGNYFDLVDSIQFYYYGQTCFEIYKKDAVLSKVHFTDGRFKLYIKDKPLDGNTSLSEIAKLYPASFQDSYDWQDDQSKKTYRLVWINTRPFADTDTKWIFKFYKGKLIEIEYRIPC